MDFVILFGPPAVGKMTVGYELSRLTGIPLFHNHMTIDLLTPFFPYGTPAFGRLLGEFRRRVFEEIAAGEGPGVIFTFVWALQNPKDRAYVDEVCAIFSNARVALVELYADQPTRLARNRTPLRLEHKPVKRDLAWSDANLRELDANHALNSDGDFFYPDRHLRLDTTDLTPEASARLVQARFGLPTLAAETAGSASPPNPADLRPARG